MKCLPLCICVPDLMWHLTRCDSSWCLQREARLVLSQCGGCLHPTMWNIRQERNWKEGDLAQRVMRFDSFQVCSLFVWLYLVRSYENKEMCNWYWAFIDFWGQYLFTGQRESGLSINVRSRAKAIQKLLCHWSDSMGWGGLQPLRDFSYIYMPTHVSLI